MGKTLLPMRHFEMLTESSAQRLKRFKENMPISLRRKIRDRSEGGYAMNYAKFFHEHSGEQISVKMTDGELFSGKLFAYSSAEDNEPDPESIVVDHTELFTNEIDKIEVIG